MRHRLPAPLLRQYLYSDTLSLSLSILSLSHTHTHYIYIYTEREIYMDIYIYIYIYIYMYLQDCAGIYIYNIHIYIYIYIYTSAVLEVAWSIAPIEGRCPPVKKKNEMRRLTFVLVKQVKCAFVLVKHRGQVSTCENECAVLLMY